MVSTALVFLYMLEWKAAEGPHTLIEWGFPGFIHIQMPSNAFGTCT